MSEPKAKSHGGATSDQRLGGVCVISAFCGKKAGPHSDSLLRLGNKNCRSTAYVISLVPRDSCVGSGLSRCHMDKGVCRAFVVQTHAKAPGSMWQRHIQTSLTDLG